MIRRSGDLKSSGTGMSGKGESASTWTVMRWLGCICITITSLYASLMGPYCLSSALLLTRTLWALVESSTPHREEGDIRDTFPVSTRRFLPVCSGVFREGGA